MKNEKLVSMVEAAMMAALSFVLNLFIVYKMPQGGTVTAGAMVPIIIVALRRGAPWGILAGAVSGLLQFISTGEAIHPASILLDYLLAYAVLGVSGWFSSSLPKVMFGTVFAVILRFVCHLLSGALIFASYAPDGQNPWLYSMGYNASYMLPELVITVAVTIALYLFAKPLFRKKTRK
jgi:thiamine transporter